MLLAASSLTAASFRSSRSICHEHLWDDIRAFWADVPPKNVRVRPSKVRREWDGALCLGNLRMALLRPDSPLAGAHDRLQQST